MTKVATEFRALCQAVVLAIWGVDYLALFVEMFLTRAPSLLEFQRTCLVIPLHQTPYPLYLAPLYTGCRIHRRQLGYWPS